MKNVNNLVKGIKTATFLGALTYLSLNLTGCETTKPKCDYAPGSREARECYQRENPDKMKFPKWPPTRAEYSPNVNDYIV